MSPSAITQRLRIACNAADLRTELRLYAKVDMSPAGITRRLREVAALRQTCLKLGRMRPVVPPPKSG